MFSHNNLPTLKWQIQKGLCLLLLTSLLFTSCQKEATTQLEAAIVPQQESVQEAAERLITLVKKHGIISKLVAVPQNPISATAKSRNSETSQSPIDALNNNADFKQYNAILQQAINPDDYECNPTFLNDYLASITEHFTAEDAQILNNFSIIPLYEALIFDNTMGGDYFGAEGEYTSSLQKHFIKIKRFWDIPTDIQLADMHGTVFENVAVVSEIIQLLFIGGFDENGNPFPIAPEVAQELAQTLKFVFGTDTFDNYNHPLFTFNAVALSAIPELGISNKIIMGDGIMEAYRANGLRTIAEPFILAHEYGHQIQFAQNLIRPGARTPEGTRRIELMADAYAAYYMAHGRGEFAQPAVITQFVKTSNAIGDCAFGNPGHHGTPNQRAKAAAFGGKLAKRTGFIDSKLTSQEFFILFEGALEEIIAPDAE